MDDTEINLLGNVFSQNRMFSFKCPRQSRKIMPERWGFLNRNLRTFKPYFTRKISVSTFFGKFRIENTKTFQNSEALPYLGLKACRITSQLQFCYPYKERYKVERTFGWQDTYRRLAVSYDRLEEIRLGFRHLAYAMINFRVTFNNS